jgi:hypothetical protein
VRSSLRSRAARAHARCAHVLACMLVRHAHVHTIRSRGHGPQCTTDVPWCLTLPTTSRSTAQHSGQSAHSTHCNVVIPITHGLSHGMRTWDWWPTHTSHCGRGRAMLTRTRSRAGLVRRNPLPPAPHREATRHVPTSVHPYRAPSAARRPRATRATPLQPGREGGQKQQSSSCPVACKSSGLVEAR